MKRDLDNYLQLRYPMEIVEAEEGGYFAHFPDLPGCIAQGETLEEAVRNLDAAKRAWIEVRLEDGLDVPPPHEPVEEYSGRFLMRVPRSLHRELAIRARREGTSLNQYVLHLLSLALGREQRPEGAVGLPQEALAFQDFFSLALASESTQQTLFGRPSSFPPRIRWIGAPTGQPPQRTSIIIEGWGQEGFLVIEGEQPPRELTDAGVVRFADQR